MVKHNYSNGSLAALALLGMEKTAARRYAAGIPSRVTSKLPTIKADSPLTWTMAVQEHHTKRARKHYDLRLVDNMAGKAHSWAIPKARMPKPGEKLLAVQTWTHTPDYALHFGEHKTEHIRHGYGKGSVRMAQKGPVQILESNNDKVRFSLGKGNREFLLRRTHNDKWLLMNTTKSTR